MARDFRNKAFQKVLRGYAPEEVDEYIAYLNEEYRKMERRAAESDRKLALAQKKLDDAMKNAGTVDSVGPAAREAAAKLLRDAEVKGAEMIAAAEAQAAERAAETVQAAVREAEEILCVAKTEAELHKNDAKRVYATAQSLFGEIGAFKERLFSLYNEHLDAVDGITEAAQEFMNGIDGTYPEGASEGTDAAEEAGVVDEPEDVEEQVEEMDKMDEIDDSEPEEEDESMSEDEEYAYDMDEDEWTEEEEPEEEPVSDEIAENLTFMDRVFASQLRSEEVEREEEDLYIDITEDEFEEPVITIDWKNRSAFGRKESVPEETMAVDESEDFREIDGFDDVEEVPYEEETEENYDDYGNAYVEDYEEEPEDDGFGEEDTDDEEDDEYRDMDAIFNEDPSKRELSLTDEFNIIFADDKSRDNVQEISRQPTVTPEAPKKGKKHKGF